MPNEEGIETAYELDDIVIYDTVPMLVESKAGTISAAARKGAPSFREDVGKLIVNAQEQCLRTMQPLKCDGTCTIMRLKKGG